MTSVAHCYTEKTLNRKVFDDRYTIFRRSPKDIRKAFRSSALASLRAREPKRITLASFGIIDSALACIDLITSSSKCSLVAVVISNHLQFHLQRYAFSVKQPNILRKIILPFILPFPFPDIPLCDEEVSRTSTHFSCYLQNID